MTVFALAFVIGVLNGLRSFTPPAAAAWAAHLRWINLHGHYYHKYYGRSRTGGKLLLLLWRQDWHGDIVPPLRG